MFEMFKRAGPDKIVKKGDRPLNPDGTPVVETGLPPIDFNSNAQGARNELAFQERGTGRGAPFVRDNVVDASELTPGYETTSKVSLQEKPRLTAVEDIKEKDKLAA